jgi:hypothetical protein
MPFDHLTIVYPADLAATEVDEIVTLVDQAGLDAEVRPAEVRRGGTGMEPWQVLVVMSSSSFLNAFVQDAGKDAWKAVVTVVRRVARRRPGERPPGDGELVVDVQDRRLAFAFGDDALGDPRAFTCIPQLLESGPEPGSSFRWDRDLGRWTDR